MTEHIDQNTEQYFYECLEQWYEEERADYEERDFDSATWEDFLDEYWDGPGLPSGVPQTAQGLYEQPGTIAEFVHNRPLPYTPGGRYTYLFVMVVRAAQGGSMPSRFADRNAFEAEYLGLMGIAERTGLLGGGVVDDQYEDGWLRAEES